MSTDPSTLEGGEKFSREKALPALPHRSAPLAPAASGRSNEAAGAKPSGPPAPPAALRDQVAAAPSSSGPRSGVAGTCGPTRACGVRRGSFLGPAPTGHPPGAAPRPQAKPRRLQPPARSGVLAALESAGPDPRRCGDAVPGVGERERDLLRWRRECAVLCLYFYSLNSAESPAFYSNDSPPTHTHTHTHTQTHTSTHTPTHTYLHTDTYIHTPTYTHTHMHTHPHAHTHTLVWKSTTLGCLGPGSPLIWIRCTLNLPNSPLSSLSGFSLQRRSLGVGGCMRNACHRDVIPKVRGNHLWSFMKTENSQVSP